MLQVWKQKGEEYRIVHGDGWQWLRATRRYRLVPQNTVGLRCVSIRLQAWKKARQVADIKKEEPRVNEAGEEDEVKDKAADNHCEEDGKTDVKIEDEKTDVKMEEDEKTDVKMEEDVKPDAADSNKEKVTEKSTSGFKSELKVQFGSTEEDALQTKFDEVLDVSSALLKHTHYPKVPKTISKLDSLLERRIRQHAYEIRQKNIIEQVLMKFKIQENARKAQKEKLEKQKKAEESEELEDGKMEAEEEPGGRDMEIEAPESLSKSKKKPELPKHQCYSATCFISATGDSSSACYSAACQASLANARAQAERAKGEMDNELSDESDDETTSVETHMKEKSQKDGFQNSFINFVKSDSATKAGSPSVDDNDKAGTKTEESSENKRLLTKEQFEKEKHKKLDELRASLLPGNIITVHQLCRTLIMSVPLLSLQYLMQGGKLQITPSVIPDLQAKYYMIGRTEYRVQLARFARGGRSMPKNRSVIKKGALPPVHKFIAPSSIRSIMVIDKYDQRNLSRHAGKIETPGFNYSCKMNNVNWFYPCPRPHFKIGWRYRMQQASSLASVALQLRILWASLRWDDLQVKPPQGGTNTTTTETDITTTEVLKRRDVAAHQLRSEYLIRKIVVPLGLQNPQRGEEQADNKRDCVLG